MSATSSTLGGHSFKFCQSVQCKEKLSPRDNHAYCIWCLTPDHFDGPTVDNVTHANQTCPSCLEFKIRAYAERSARRALGRGVTSKAYRQAVISGQSARSSGIQGAQFDSEHSAPPPPTGVSVVKIVRSSPVTASLDPSGDGPRPRKSRKSAHHADRSGRVKAVRTVSAQGLDSLNVSHVSASRGMSPAQAVRDASGEAGASRLGTVHGTSLPRTDTVCAASGLAEQTAQSSVLRAQGSVLRAQSSELRAQSSVLRAQSSELGAQSSELSAGAGSELGAQSSELSAQSSERGTSRFQPRSSH
jgi:hypothetical protein